jgi:hypothetical protein
LKHLKYILHAIVDGGIGAQSGAGETDDEGRETPRRRANVMKRLTPILNLLSHETIRESFGTDDHEAIWQEMKAQGGR